MLRRCRIGKHRRIGAITRKDVSQASNDMSKTFEREPELIGNVVIEKKIHRSNGRHLASVARGA